MPPKKKPAEPGKKAEQQKKKEKVIEDKTFGLKNKKGAKSQKIIQKVQQRVNQGGKKAEAQMVADKKKDEKKKEAEQINALFRPVASQKIDKDVDPKSVLCTFYKQGQCTKGEKCKFSHDLSVERKSAKRSIYVDVRDLEEDGMENWDEEKLKDVVEQKHGEADRRLPKTDIICKYFLDALENKKYGYFWECPAGANKCHYRHALPQGFVLKKGAKREELQEKMTIEDVVEKRRSQLGYNLTPMTFEILQQWKKEKLIERKERERREETRKREELKAGRSAGLSGRDMFTFQPELAKEDAMEEGEVAFDSRSVLCGETSDQCKEISVAELAKALENIGDSGTVASVRHWQKVGALTSQVSSPGEPGDETDDDDSDVPIDESLFEDYLGDIDDDLED